MMSIREEVEAAAQRVQAVLSAAKAEIEEVFEVLRDKLDPPTPPAAPQIQYATHRYYASGPIPQDVSFLDVQDWEGFKTAPWPSGAERYLFAAFVKRPGDSKGWTQYLPPGFVSETDLATRSDNGQPVYRTTNGGDYLLNLANPDLRHRMVQQHVARAVERDVEGVYADEIDQTWEWAWPGVPGIRQFPTMDHWRNALLNLCTELADALHARGMKLWVNLGADYDLSNPWQAMLVDEVDGVNIEFFAGRDGVKQPPAVGEDLLRALRFIRKVETETDRTAVHVHASTSTQAVVDYAFGAWLLATELRGSFTASPDYAGGYLAPSQALRDRAHRLGQPIEPYYHMGSGALYRKFEHGFIVVNHTNQLIGITAPRSVRIEVSK